MTPTVAAVVVTWQRPRLLRACLSALRGQSRPPDAIYVVDNASSDETPALLAAEAAHDARLVVLRQATNLGGAGGFTVGLREACAAGHGWFWMMDDDTLPDPGALTALLRAATAFPPRLRPDLLASLVLWRDGRPHPMNRAAPCRRNGPFAEHARRLGLMPIRAASFVSILVARRALVRAGLPQAEYHLCMDDVEHTHRLLRRGRGVLVPPSRVLHDTATPTGVLETPPARLRLVARNGLWTLRFSEGLDGGERVLHAIRLVLTLMRCLLRPGGGRLRAIAAGLHEAVATRRRLRAGMPT